MTDKPRETTTPVQKGYRRSRMNSQRDPITAFHDIREGIQTVLDKKCYGATLVLIYAGIDAMANLARPEGQVQVHPDDFVAWVERYLKVAADEKISGAEWYSARCAVLHTYGVESNLTRGGNARMLGYMAGGYPPVKYDPKVDQNLVIVDCVALAEAFLKGLAKFMVDLFADPEKRELNESRLRKLFINIPVE